MEERNDAYLRRYAESDFEDVYMRGFRRGFMNWLYGRSGKLLSYEDIRALLPEQNESYAGMHEIPMDKIVGSVSRYNDFDNAFLPRQRHTRDRWVNIDVANLKYIDLPPIEVYKVGDIYFVKDGNHRVSVARDKGQQFIDAHVIEINTPIPVDKDTDLPKLVLAQERFEFYKKTHLHELEPDADIRLSLPGQYSKLLEHIAVHRYFMGENAGHPISEEEAVKHWYEAVYSPLAAVVEKDHLLENFPGRTIADLYLWIIEHLWYMRARDNKDVSVEEAATHFTDTYSRSARRRLRKLIESLATLVADVDRSETPDSPTTPETADPADDKSKS